MGLAALARRGCVIHSTTSPTQSWRVTLTPAHFLGRESAPVHPASATRIEPYPSGAEITFTATEDLPAITKVLTSAASYYPLPVYLNGDLLTRRAYLHNALHTETWPGVTFGRLRHALPLHQHPRPQLSWPLRQRPAPPC